MLRRNRSPTKPLFSLLPSPNITTAASNPPPSDHLSHHAMRHSRPQNDPMARALVLIIASSQATTAKDHSSMRTSSPPPIRHAILHASALVDIIVSISACSPPLIVNTANRESATSLTTSDPPAMSDQHLRVLSAVASTASCKPQSSLIRIWTGTRSSHKFSALESARSKKKPARACPLEKSES